MAASTIALYCVLFPAGLWGGPIKGALATGFGLGRYFLPCLTGYVGCRLAISRPWSQGALRTVLWSSLFFFGVSFISLFSQLAYGVNAGGVLGLAGTAFLSRLFGTGGAWVVTISALGLLAAALARVSPVALAESLVRRLRLDLDEWKRARGAKAPPRDPVVKARPVVAEPPPAARSTPTVALPVAPKFSPVSADPPSTKIPARAPVEPVPSSLPRKEGEVAEFVARPYCLPPLDLLDDPTGRTVRPSESDLVEKSRVLERTLASFGVEARTTDIHPGPVITRFDLEPAPGVKISSIVNLSNDIALAMKATRVRVLAPIPGKGAVGVEIPNPEMVTVTLKEILSDSRFQASRSPLAVVLGKTSSGEPYMTDLAPMPHLDILLGFLLDR
jgi:S-DNA-T family DNA segregation ATPase FtsK/SpoIIIE